MILIIFLTTLGLFLSLVGFLNTHVMGDERPRPRKPTPPPRTKPPRAQPVKEEEIGVIK